MGGGDLVAGPGESAQDVAARDDAHLESLGIKPQLNRTLGFLSNFAIAFAFISVSTGTFGNYGVGIGLSGPAFYWTWFVVIAGQLLVALVFAELASHFPVAGSVYQWSKRLSNRTLGWFTGWFYFWAQVVTVSAVAVIVAFVIDGLHTSLVGVDPNVAFLDSGSPGGFTSMFTFIALGTLVITTLINAYGVRLLSILNNIGVATEILGMFVFGIILLVFANVQPASVLTSFQGSEAAQNGNIPATFALGFFMAAFVVYGFDTAGSFGEETLDAARQAPRGVLSSILISGLVGAIFIPAVILATPDIPGSMAEGLKGGFPIATTISNAFSQKLIGNLTGGDIYLLVILASVFVCTLAIQGAATRLMFSMGRDRHLPLGGVWGHVNPRFRTPANAAVAVGVIAAVPILVVGPGPAISISIAATGLIYVSYFMCNAGVLVARMRGWPHKRAWFNLGRWGMIVNLLALIYGGLMIINIALWADGSLFGDWGSDGRLFWNPFINTFIKPFGNEIPGLPAWPVFETLVGAILFFGAIYYIVAVRGTAHDVETQADMVTGEAVIG
jgi:urea carboxylase system permease